LNQSNQEASVDNLNELNRALYAVLKDLQDNGMTREASLIINEAERIAASPEVIRNIQEVGRSGLGLKTGPASAYWNTMGPVLGWFRMQSGPARGIPLPQLMPGESMTSFTRRCQQWMQDFAKISGHEEVTTAMQQLFAMIRKPGNMQQLEAINQKIYQEFQKNFAAANAKAKQRGKSLTPKSEKTP
jgi:hypothetical protein